MNVGHPLGGLVDTLDGVRRQALALTLRTRLSWLVVERDRRLGVQASVGVFVTFLLAALFPMTLVSVSPALLGVPHVASDIRYLVLRRRLPETWLRVTVLFGSLLFVLRAVEGATAMQLGRLEVVLAAGWLLAATWIGAGRAHPFRALAIASGAVARAALAFMHPHASRVAFAHLHNVVGIVVWVALFRRSRRAAIAPILLASALTGILLGGATLDHALAHPSLGLSLERLATVLAPGLEHTRLGLGITLSYVYLQGVHYAVWLGWIPQDDVKGEGTITFRMSLKSAVADFGPRGIRLVLLASLAMLVASAWDLQLSRSAYLSLATFHGYLELATLTLFLARPRVGASLPA